jgi:hypothetical protein
MPFAFNPDDGPPRLIRYVERGTLPGVGLRALYDSTMNLLIVDRVWFEGLGWADKHQVLRTHKPYLDTESRIAA